MGGKKKKGKTGSDDLWDEVKEVSGEAGATQSQPPPGGGTKGKKGRKNKGFADLEDDLEAMEAEMTGVDGGPDELVVKTGGDVGGDTQSQETSAKDSGEATGKDTGAGGKGGKKNRKKKKKAEAEVDDDELEATLCHIEGGGAEGLKHPSSPDTKGDTTFEPSQEKVTPAVAERTQPQPSEPSRSVPDSNSDTIKDAGASKPPGDGADNPPEGEEEEGDVKKKKKKKKKKPEEEKKPKRAGKGAPIAEIKRLQAAVKEEERLRQEEALRQQREEEERERQREEKLRLEKERKERAKQKEKERRLKRKLEGKPVTKKEREAEARRQAQLNALREQGVSIPEKEATGGEKKKVVYGKRQRGKKTKVEDSTEDGPTADDTITESEEVQTEEAQDSVIGTWEDFADEEEAPANNVKESWDDVSADEIEPVDEPNVDDSEGAESDSEDTEESSDSEEELTLFDKAKRRIEERRISNEAARSEDNLRSPVVCVLGHVDTGKTKILDKIRKTHVQDGEAGGITQQIGATFVPLDSIKEQTKMIKEFAKVNILLPGLLIIDTPGHESFSNLRTRGSSLCDIAILVVDLMHGLEPQTLESISILQKGRTPFIVALNKIDRLFDWQRNPNSSVRDTIKRQKVNTKNQFDERVKLTVTEFAEKGMNVALFWDKVDFTEYIPLVPTSAITGDGMGDLIALIVTYSQKLLSKQLMLSREVEAVVMEVKVISGLGTTVDVILRNGELKEGDTIVLTGIDGPFVTTIRALLMPQPLRELRVKNAYLTPSKVCAAQGIKITAKGELDKTVAGTPLFVATRQDEVDVLKEEAALAMKSALSAIKLQERGVYVQASTLGSLEALLEFLKQSKIPYCGVNIGPVHKRDVMKASVMLEHDSHLAVILAFDVKIERDGQEMADSLGVKIFSADIIYHLFDAFLKHRKEYRDQKRKEFESVAVFPCKLRILPNCIFNTRDPIILGVVIESGALKPGTPLTVPSKNFTDIGVVSSLELNHKNVDIARQGSEVCIKVEPTGDAPRLYGRHFDYTDTLVSKISRESIDAVKNYFREDMQTSDWQLIIELKKAFGII